MFGFLKKKTPNAPLKPKSNTTMYMSNHVTPQDLTYLHHKLPSNVHFIVFDKGEFDINGKNMTERNITLFEELTPQHMKQIISLAETGDPILLFPEMRVSRNGRVMKVYQEFALIAKRLEATIYPIIIEAPEQKTNAIQSQIGNFLDKTPSIHIGRPFSLDSDDKEVNAGTIYRQLTTLYVNNTLKKGLNLFNELLEKTKRFDQQKIMVKDPTSELSYRKLLIGIQVLSSKLESTLTDKQVGVLLPSAIGHVVTLFSLFKIGITPAILNFTMGHRTMLDCCETANLKTILTSKQFIEKGELHELIAVLKKEGLQIIYLEDIKEGVSSKDKLIGLKNYASSQRAVKSENEIILFTSGSENKPKGVVLTHDQLYANIEQAMAVMDLGTHDRMLNPLPMFHSFGLTIGTFLPILSGIPLVIYPSPIQYKVIPELIYQEDITLLLSTPTFLNGYGKNAQPFDLHTLRYAIAGAESVKEETKELFYNKFGIRILEGYGATEASPLIALNTPMFTKAGSVGKVIPTLDYKVEKVEGIESGGSLHIKGPNIMKGYLIHGKGFIPHEGWYNTGDVVDLDEHGYITIKSRLKRFAKIGGEMISLNLVENIAMECYDDIGFATVSIPDKRKGEKIILFTSVDDVQGKELKRFIKTHKYSAILLPQEVIKVEEIPLLGSGKTDYVSLEKMAKEQFQS
ncbi:AMP-binding protein [Bacillus sp. FJAT-45350]|uniref:AMP-binding protein n=1 Tax=Bacillus sp. FJAT-45350 TaxID=2011014 RepID=UPI000BB792C0|nr:AMP-binding protein [Bacillus sp. FJAT-45350]